MLVWCTISSSFNKLFFHIYSVWKYPMKSFISFASFINFRREAILLTFVRLCRFTFWIAFSLCQRFLFRWENSPLSDYQKEKFCIIHSWALVFGIEMCTIQRREFSDMNLLKLCGNPLHPRWILFECDVEWKFCHSCTCSRTEWSQLFPRFNVFRLWHVRESRYASVRLGSDFRSYKRAFWRQHN